MLNGAREPVRHGRRIQPLHRHADMRLILFTKSTYTERTFLQSDTFEPGDFVMRPAYYGHDGRGAVDAAYMSLPLSQRSLRAFGADHGWRARRGHVALEGLCELLRDPHAGDEVLSAARLRPMCKSHASSPMEKIAVALSKRRAPSMAALAEAHVLKPWELTRRFRETYWLSPSQFRLEVRVQEALKLMAETCLSLSDIADAAGFTDQSHLCRSVRRTTGQSPALLRRQIACG